MATLSKDSARTYELGEMNNIGVVATDIIYEGSAVGDNGAGYARPLVAGDPFLGFARDKVDNATGAAGVKNVEANTSGRISLSIAALAITDVGKDVYASDDDTFTLTQSTNTRIGRVVRFVAAGVGIVAFATVKSREAELTDSSGGTASGAIAAIGAAYSQAEVRNAVASLAAKVNYLLRRLGA